MTNKNLTENTSIMQTYLREINNVPLLSRDEEYDLAVKAKSGDKSAREKLIRANLRFVVSIAKQFQNRGLSFEDLVSEGNVGLITAVDKFEPEKGYHFISYGVWWIRQAIMKAVAEQSRMIRLPMNRNAQYVQVTKSREKLIKEGFEGSLEQVAADCGLSETDVAEILSFNKEITSLDAPVGDEDSSSFGDFIESKEKSPEDETIDTALKEQFERLLSRFPERERKIIMLRYGLIDGHPMSLKQVGDAFGLTKERIRQLEKQTLRSLGDSSEVQEMKCYIA